MAASTLTSTWVHDSLAASDLSIGLAAFGYEPGATIQHRRTLLDTFDGRLFAAGISLEHVEQTNPAGPALLRLTTADGVPAALQVRRAPRFASDLPPGPFRERLTDPLEMRATIPLATWSDTQVELVGRDGRGNVIVRATVHASDATGRPAIVEVTPSPGRDDAADELVATIRALGGHRSEHGLIDLVSATLGVNRRGYDSSPDVELAHDIAALDGFRLVFANLATTIDANLAGTIDDIDTEFLHEFRVAIRRTRSVLGLGKNVLTDSGREQARADFAWLAGVTGPLRDLDVYILDWDHSVGHLATDRADQLQPVLLHLQQHRRAAWKRLAADLRSPRTQRLLGDWTAGISDLEPGPDADRPLREIAAKRIAKAHTMVLANGRAIDSASPAEALHDLRKDAKKLRYAVECFGGLLPAKRRKAFVRQLKDLQDNLGRHQDAEVHSAELQVVARELSAEQATPPTLLALGQLIEHLEIEKIAARSEFAERFATFDSNQTECIVTDLLESLEP